jgi:hypothetical protein
MTLVFLSGSRRGTAFAVRDGEMSAGRGLDCALRFDPNDSVVSTHHATLTRRNGSLFIRDNGSRNGTFVDGHRITEAELRPGQIVTFGANGPAMRVESASGASAGATNKTGLTQLFHVAREKSAAASPTGEASQTAIFKAFVHLAQQRSSRRLKLWLAATAAVALAAIFGVVAWNERRAEQLRGELTLVGAELANQSRARAALEQQLADYQKSTSSLTQTIQSDKAEIDRQRRQLEAQRQTVQSDGRFGPTVTERFASGVGLIQVRIGWRHPQHGWLRLRGTPDGKLTFTTTENDSLALLTVSHCTGFLIDRAGWVLTNRHCLDYGYPDKSSLDEDALELKGSGGTAKFAPAIASIRVSFPPGKIFTADGATVSVSNEHDLGVFRTSAAPAGVPVLPLARGDQQKIVAGEDVVMLAYPGGAEVTAQRRGLGSFVDASLREQVIKAEEQAVDQFMATSGAASYLNALGPMPKEPEKIRALLAANPGLRVLRSTMFSVQSEAMLDTLARAGQVQPDVSSRMSVSGVRSNSISYHTLSGIGGSSGAPVIGTRLVVVGVNHAGFAETDRGKQFQQSEAVPIEFAIRFLPATVKGQ